MWLVPPDLAHWELYEDGASSSFGSAVPGWLLGGIAGHFFGTNVRKLSLVHGVKPSQFSATTIAGSVFLKSFMLSATPILFPSIRRRIPWSGGPVDGRSCAIATISLQCKNCRRLPLRFADREARVAQQIP